MKKTLLMASMLAATIANAETFSTSADVTKVLTPLSITEKTAMVLPQVQVDESTPDGSVICATYYTPFPTQNYCTGTGNNGSYTVAGTPFSNVAVTIEQTGNTVTDGISFQAYHTVNNVASRSITLASNGSFDVELRGDMKVNDKAAVVSKTYVFNFDLTAVYQ